MSAQHTPGPWMVLPSVVESQFVILTEHGIRQDIALTYGFESTPREANARLIAAAPTMYDYIADRADSGDQVAKSILESVHASS